MLILTPLVLISHLYFNSADNYDLPMPWPTSTCLFYCFSDRRNGYSPGVNPLPMNDNYSHHRNLAACYRLAQSVLKIRSALAERVGQGEVGGCTPMGDSAWRLLQLAIESPGQDGPFFCFLAHTSVENCPFTL